MIDGYKSFTHADQVCPAALFLFKDNAAKAIVETLLLSMFDAGSRLFPEALVSHMNKTSSLEA